MFKKGIMDAAKVTRSALQNAASIAAMVLTTETLITDNPEKQAAAAGGATATAAGTWTSRSASTPQHQTPRAGSPARGRLFAGSGIERVVRHHRVKIDHGRGVWIRVGGHQRASAAPNSSRRSARSASPVESCDNVVACSADRPAAVP